MTQEDVEALAIWATETEEGRKAIAQALTDERLRELPDDFERWAKKWHWGDPCDKCNVPQPCMFHRASAELRAGAEMRAAIIEHLRTCAGWESPRRLPHPKAVTKCSNCGRTACDCYASKATETPIANRLANDACRQCSSHCHSLSTAIGYVARLEAALAELHAEVESAEAVGICLPDRVPSLVAAEALAVETAPRR